MSIQLEHLRLSFHANSMVDSDMFHVRIVTKDEQIAPFLRALLALPVEDERGFYLSGECRVNDVVFCVNDAELNDGVIQLAYGSIHGAPHIYWSFERRGADIYLDFNISKTRGAENSLDYTRPVEVPITFWIEPATVIRTMMGRTN